MVKRNYPSVLWHMSAGLKALVVSGVPFSEKRDGLGFEDRLAILPGGRMAGNGEVDFVGTNGACREESGDRSASVNALHGLAAPDKQRGLGRPTNSREKVPYERLSKRKCFCSICRREGHKRTTCL